MRPDTLPDLGEFQGKMRHWFGFNPNSDLENKTLPLSSHCESRQKREKVRGNII
jgi:hypothetical protein